MTFRKTLSYNCSGSDGSGRSELYSRQYNGTHTKPAAAAYPYGRSGQVALRIVGGMVSTYEADVWSEKAVVSDLDAVDGLDVATGHITWVACPTKANIPG